MIDILVVCNHESPDEQPIAALVGRTLLKHGFNCDLSRGAADALIEPSTSANLADIRTRMTAARARIKVTAQHLKERNHRAPTGVRTMPLPSSPELSQGYVASIVQEISALPSLQPATSTQWLDWTDKTGELIAVAHVGMTPSNRGGRTTMEPVYRMHRLGLVTQDEAKSVSQHTGLYLTGVPV